LNVKSQILKIHGFKVFERGPFLFSNIFSNTWLGSSCCILFWSSFNQLSDNIQHCIKNLVLKIGDEEWNYLW
jgi:hypothetical protein